MVTADVNRATGGIQSALEDMDVRVMAPLAVLGAGGVFLAQEAIDLVFPRLNLNPDPTSARGLGAAFLLKMALAIGLVTAGQRFGGRPLAGVATVLALGVMIHGGADLLDMAQRGGLPGSSPRSGGRSSASARTSTSSANVTVKSTGSSGGTTRAASAGGTYR